MAPTRSWLAPSAALLAAFVAACAAGSPSPATSAGPVAVAGPPQVVIQSPPSNAQVVVGQAVEVVTTGVDSVGVARIDLSVNGSTVSSAESPPGGLASFSAVYQWVPAVEGEVALAAVAYRTDGAPSEPMTIAVMVLPAGASVAPYPTFAGAVPTYRAVAVPSNYAAPTYAPKPTYAVGATALVTPTAYANATATDQANPTPTYTTSPSYTTSPTYTTTPTYTTSPTTLVAPPDATYSWVIPYNGSGEISDDVSYPGGDTQDRVNYDVSGMSASPPGNTGHMNVFATCTGTGTQYVTFYTGGHEYHCGDQIIDKDITDESRTGSVLISITNGNAYVHWTLSGNVAP